MLDISIISIFIIIAFIGVGWYANHSRKQRDRLLDDIRNMEPSLGDSESFEKLYRKELDQQNNDIDYFDIDSSPEVTLSEGYSERFKSSAKQMDDIDAADRTTGDKAEIEQSETLQRQESQMDDAQPDLKSDVKDWDMVIAFTVMAREGSLFSGRSIKATLESLDLHFGDMQIYHRKVPGLRNDSIFSVANILDPGTLNPDTFATMKTPGLLIFARLPGPINGLAVFDDLLDAAQKMTDKLDGVLSDEAREPISQSSIEAMRSRILALNIQLQTQQNHYNNDFNY